MSRLFALVLVVASAELIAAPPPGHPTPDQAAQLLGLPQAAQLPNVGRVVQAIDSNNYTYLEVAGARGNQWLAVQRLVVAPGDTVRFGDGAVMRNFYSKVLQRTFAEILFVGEVAVVASGTP